MRVLPNRWDAIQKLYMTFYFPDLAWIYTAPEQIRFFDTCATLSSMSNLRKVVIGLVVHEDSNSPDYRSTKCHVLRHLDSITVRGEFVVYITWEMEEIEDIIDESILTFRILQFPDAIKDFHRGQPLNNFLHRLTARSR
jgi:hypothetical protein